MFINWVHLYLTFCRCLPPLGPCFTLFSRFIILVRFAIVGFPGCKVCSNCALDGILLLSILGVLCYNLSPLYLSCFSRAAERRRGKSGGGASSLCICAMPSSFFPAYEHKALYTEAGFAFLCYYVYLMSLGILAPGVITCWQFYSS